MSLSPSPSELRDVTRKELHGTPRFGTCRLCGDGSALRPPQSFGGRGAGSELAVQSAEERMRVRVRNGRERADDVGRACSEEGAAERESARLCRAGTAQRLARRKDD